LQAPHDRSRICVLSCICWVVGLFGRRTICPAKYSSYHKSLDPSGGSPHGGFLFGNTSQRVRPREASSRRVKRQDAFAPRTLLLVLLFGEKGGVCDKPVVDARVTEILRRSPRNRRHPPVPAGIPTGYARQIGLAQCTDPLYHCVRPPRLVTTRGRERGGLI
jgi:hypothetical protein